MRKKSEAIPWWFEYAKTFARKTSASALHVLIAASLVFSPVVPWQSTVWAATPEETASPQTPQPDQDVVTRLSQIERGEVAQWSTAEADIAKVVDQSLEILSGRSWIKIDLNATAVEIPIVPFTSLKIVYDAQAKELIFQGLRGVDSKGENGQIVARQTIRNVDLLSSSQDAEFFQFIDHKYRLNVIDLGFVAEQVFKAPIPVFQNLWAPTGEIATALEKRDQGKKIVTGFLTRGTPPMDFSKALIAPRDPEGRLMHRAGDFYVAQQGPAGQLEPIGLFSRETTYRPMPTDSSGLRRRTGTTFF